MDYVHERKAGKVKSEVHDVDMLSLFLESPDIFTDIFIVNELMDFFFAGSQTTQYVSQTIITHFVHKPDSLKKVRDELKKVTQEQFPDEVSSNDCAYLNAVMKVEVFQDLEYLSTVINEALRYESPVTLCTSLRLKADCKLGAYEFKKGDIVAHHVYGLHMNGSEW